MAACWIWWIAAALLIGEELLTGTFYLLAVGIAAAFGGVAAWFGADVPMQFLIAGGLGVVLTAIAHQWRRKRGVPPPQPSLDIGGLVRVEKWKDDGGARVAYRGSTWDAELESPQTPRVESLYIVAMRGSVLVLSDRRPA